MKTTQEVIDRYLAAFDSGSPDEILQVFSDDSMVICGDDVHKGLKEIRKFFAYVMGDVLPPDAQIASKHHVVEDDIAYFVWSGKSERCEVDLGLDVLLVKDGVIARQAVFLGFKRPS
jgi:SnoaL-like domain